MRPVSKHFAATSPLASRLLKLVALAPACLWLSAPESAAQQAGRKAEPRDREKPNIVLIMSDDMGFSDIEPYGSEFETPALSRLAENGLRFSQFYNTARCCPTRAALLTGLYPSQTGLGFMTGDEGLPGYRGEISDNTVTLAEALKPAGYRAYMSGKWHVARNLKDEDSLKYNWPMQRGFDKFYGTIIGAGSHWDPWTLARGNTYITPLNDAAYQPEEKWYYTDAISDNAVMYIDEHTKESADAPFFMYVSYTAPHWPLHAPEEEIALHKGAYDGGYAPIREGRYDRLKSMGLIDEEWELSESEGDWEAVENKEWHARNMEVYAAMITRMDKGIGKIVDKLEREGLLDNTLILYLQDNGACAEDLSWFGLDGREEGLPELRAFEPMGPDELQPQMFPKQTRDGFPVLIMNEEVLAGSDRSYHAYGEAWANVSNTPFREYKHWVHEGGIATPLIAHWPAVIEDRNQLRHQPGYVIDIMATVVEIAGAEYPTQFNAKAIAPLEGESLLKVFTSNQDLERETLYFEHEGNRAVRKGQWKLVSKAFEDAGALRTTDVIDLDEWELYNIENDRTETINLAHLHRDLVKELSDQWHAWAKRTMTIPKP